MQTGYIFFRAVAAVPVTEITERVPAVRVMAIRVKAEMEAALS
jgi:hypothetical protein